MGLHRGQLDQGHLEGQGGQEPEWQDLCGATWCHSYISERLPELAHSEVCRAPSEAQRQELPGEPEGTGLLQPGGGHHEVVVATTRLPGAINLCGLID